ncbi:MAG: ABC transporter permease [Clostridiaceae bacterium]|jgi:ABC-2 type transport system permease protein|nr:ABC transporter permease [Clostridiaceae bacterium]
MPVFQAYKRVIKKSIPQLLIYIIVFVTFAAILMSSGAPASTVRFDDARARIAFMDEADSSILTEGLKNYLLQYADFVDVKHDQASLQDALFFDEVDYILRIPAGFTEGFLEGKPVGLEKISLPNSVSSVYLDININKYMNMARFYLANIPGIIQQELVDLVSRDLSVETAVEVRPTAVNADAGETLSIFYNYMSYVLLNLLILGVGTFMLVFNQRDLRRRTLCSPVPLRQQNMQILLGNLIYAVVCWIIMMALGFVLYGKAMPAKQTILVALNTFVFTFVCLSISFLIGSALSSRNALSAVTNVLSLGMCFTSGAFVPQYLIGEQVLAFARILPTYWYVKYNNEIINMANITWDLLKPRLGYLGMQMGIAVAVLAVALVIIKQKRQAQEA